MSPNEKKMIEDFLTEIAPNPLANVFTAFRMAHEVSANKLKATDKDTARHFIRLAEIAKRYEERAWIELRKEHNWLRK